MHPLVQRLRILDAKLVKAGFPSVTPWWWQTIERWYHSGARQAVIRAGRRSGKSTTLSRVAVGEALSDGHVIPPGDVGVVAIVSVSRTEASERLRLVRAILDALGVKHKPIDGGLELLDRPIAFRVFTASISGVVGGSCIFALCDEVARWKDSDTGANPATEVLASLRPTLAGQPSAKIVLSSSPMGCDDAHAKAFDRGEDDFQVTARAETWIARPSLTEADCRALEPDPDTFAREYGCIPFDGSTASLLTDAQIRAVQRMPLVIPRVRGVRYYAAQDPANRGGNGWTLAIARAVTANDVTSVSVVLCREWRASKGGALNSDVTLFEVAGVLSQYGLTELWTDQWSFDSLAALAARHGVTLRMAASTQVNKVQQADALKTRIVDRTIELPDDPQVRADLLGIRRWISRNGAFSIELERSGGRHSDYAPAIMLAVDKAADATRHTPRWLTKSGREAMARLLHGTPPPAEERDFFDPTAHASRHPEAHIVLSDHDFGGTVATGRGDEFSAMHATWRRGQPPQFSANASRAFIASVNAYRSKYPQ